MVDEVVAAPVLSAHDAAMVAKVDSVAAGHGVKPAAVTPPAPPAPAVRPEHIPEKFWDAATGTAKVDDMARSYAELERARSTPTGKPPAAGEAPPADPVVAAAAAAAGEAGKGVDFAAYTSEFATAGALSEKSYTDLAAKGLPKALVDQFIAGRTAQAQVAQFQEQAATSEAFSLAGGQDAYSNMLVWAEANLSAADQGAFDKAVVGDSASRKQAIMALKAQYTPARGSNPALIAGEGAGDGAGAFGSRAEVTAAMRDPRYKADPAYRATVERRIGAMQVF